MVHGCHLSDVREQESVSVDDHRSVRPACRGVSDIEIQQHPVGDGHVEQSFGNRKGCAWTHHSQ